MTDDSTALILAALDLLKAGQVDIKADMASVKAGVTTLATDFGAVKADFAALKADFAALKADVAGLKADVATLKAGQARLESTQSKLEAALTQVRVDVMDRIDRLQNIVNLMRDDIGVNMGRADRAHQAADNTRAELRTLDEVVRGMSRQITSLQTAVRELRGDP